MKPTRTSNLPAGVIAGMPLFGAGIASSQKII